jgi:itaconate CoA-transferase
VNQALKGVRVVAVEHAVAAPLCSRHLAEMGAEVIKVERPGTGDFARHYDTYVQGEASHFSWLNRGKKSVVIDVKSDEGNQALRTLLSTADVLISNLAPGAFERIIPDAELAAYPALIRCYVSGYGTEGPYAHRKAYDMLVQGEAGVIAATGTETQYARPGISVGDLAGGTYALAAILGALVERGRTGNGQRIDISLFDSLAEWMSPLLLASKYAGDVPPPAGRGHASITPYGPYTSGEGDEIQIAVQNQGQWERLCRDVLGQEELIMRPGFVTNEDRLNNREVVEAAVQGGFDAHATTELLSLLDAADIPYGILREVPDVVDHPQLVSRNRWVEQKTQAGRDFEALLPPFLNDAEGVVGLKVPALGEHTGQVLGS